MKEYIISADDVQALEEEFNINLSFEKDDELTRCKDCRYWGKDGYREGCKYAVDIMTKYDFCSRAEPKETE